MTYLGVYLCNKISTIGVRTYCSIVAFAWDLISLEDFYYYSTGTKTTNNPRILKFQTTFMKQFDQID